MKISGEEDYVSEFSGEVEDQDAEVKRFRRAVIDILKYASCRVQRQVITDITSIFEQSLGNLGNVENDGDNLIERMDTDNRDSDDESLYSDDKSVDSDDDDEHNSDDASNDSKDDDSDDEDDSSFVDDSASENSASTRSEFSTAVNDRSGDSDVKRKIHIHDPIANVKIPGRAPPFSDVDILRVEECDCEFRGLPECILENNCDYFRHCPNPIFFDNELEKAQNNQFKEAIERNECQRFRLYGEVYRGMPAHLHVPTVRIQLPSCVMAKIRQLYPDDNGNYTGFIGK